MSFNSQRFPAAAETDVYEEPQSSRTRPRRGQGPPRHYDNGRAEAPRTPRRPRNQRAAREESQEPEAPQGRTTLDISPEALAAITNLTLSIQTFTMVVKSFMDSQDPGRR